MTGGLSAGSSNGHKNGRTRETALPRAPRVLVVDDEPPILRIVDRVLSARGCVTVCCQDGLDAARRLDASDFEVVISDISMPGMSGIELLRKVREHDLDVPVILMTGAPAIGTAVKAVEFGAFRYLTKPFDLDELGQVVSRAARLYRVARMKREALEHLGMDQMLVGDRAGLEAKFDRALDSLWIAFHPIVRPRDNQIYGYEALLRSDEPALPHPAAVVDAAERLGRLLELGRVVRERAASVIAESDEDAVFFLNLHPKELVDPTLASRQDPLFKLAERVVFEVTERAPLERVNDLSARVSALRALGYRIALDDMGAGYAGLTSFSLLEPEIVKLDMALIRGLDSSPTRQRIVESMTSLCKDLSIEVVAEGVETAAERDTLTRLGCELLQGFLFARPAPSLPPVSW
jgi:EAL domain-containing protein (putative c-di-GMP-specific phosphodiesterase class I)/CheY-like chemotaxis protein